MSFHKTKILQIYDEYGYGGRPLSSLVTIYYLIKYFKLKNILEVGFLQGQTFGLMIEASKPGSYLVSMDPILQLEIYNRYYENTEFTKDKIIEILECSFEDFDSQKKFDFIFVDSGMPNKEFTKKIKNRTLKHNEQLELDVDRTNHLLKSFKYCHDETIIALDDYQALDKISNEFLNKQNIFVPFLADDAALYFHKKTNNCTDFLDQYLDQTLHSMHDLYNVDYKGYTIKKVTMKKNTVIDLDKLNPHNTNCLDNFWITLFEHNNI